MSIRFLKLRQLPLVGIVLLAIAGDAAYAEQEFDTALTQLRAISAGSSSQAETQQAWRRVAGAEGKQMTAILAAMLDAPPLAENWLRAAVDTIAERELRATGKLPADALRQFVLDLDQSPRARRTAFEWLTRADPSAPDRILPKMLDDPSLELRHDAVAKLLTEAEEAAGDEKIEKFQRAFSAARDLGQIKRCVTALAELDRLPNVRQHLGMLTHWRLIGPFDNVEGVGYDRAYPPEQAVDFSQQIAGKTGQVEWTSHEVGPQKLDIVGTVDLNEAIVEEKGVVAYAVATVTVDSDRSAECRYETVNATKLWVNGTLVASNPVYHAGNDFDQYVAPVRLRKGENVVMLKVCQNEQTQSWAKHWSFRLRVTDKLGGGIVSHDSTNDIDR